MSANQTKILKRILRAKATWQMTPEELARVVADHKGWDGRAGGWIYDSYGVPIVQGWSSLADRLQRRGVIIPGKGINWRQLSS